MFGFDKSLWMIRDIIRILSEQETFISTSYLLELLGYSNLGQVKKLCAELQEYIQESFSENEFELITSTRNGIRLKTHAGRNAQNLMDFIGSKDLAFEIYKSVLFERVVSTEDFCQENFVSASTLQRKIIKINEEVNKNSIHLSFSRQKFSIHGKESTLRSFAFIFLYVKHRQISNVPWIKNKDYYLDLSSKIADHLELSFRSTQLESFSLFLFIFETAIQQGHAFIFEKENLPYKKDLKFPTKPPFLLWGEEEWQALLLMTYNSNIANYNIPIDTSAFYSDDFEELITEWINCFEQHFAPFDMKQRAFLSQNLLKQYFSDYMFTVDEILMKTFPAVDFRLIEQTQPFYMHRFNNFWQSLSDKPASFKISNLKTQSFLLCEYFFPLRNSQPEVKLYVFTDLTALSLHRIQDTIQVYFSNKYKITIVSTLEEADVIVGNINFREESLSEDQNFVMTRLQLAFRDFLNIDTAIKKNLLKRMSYTE